MDEWINLAKVFGVFAGTILLTLGGRRVLNRSAEQDTSPVEAQLNLRIEEKNQQIAALGVRIDNLEEDLEREREARRQDQIKHSEQIETLTNRYQTKLDDLSARFEEFRRNAS